MVKHVGCEPRVLDGQLVQLGAAVEVQRFAVRVEEKATFAGDRRAIDVAQTRRAFSDADRRERDRAAAERGDDIAAGNGERSVHGERRRIRNRGAGLDGTGARAWRAGPVGRIRAVGRPKADLDRPALVRDAERRGPDRQRMCAENRRGKSIDIDAAVVGQTRGEQRRDMRQLRPENRQVRHRHQRLGDTGCGSSRGRIGCGCCRTRRLRTRWTLATRHSRNCRHELRSRHRRRIVVFRMRCRREIPRRLFRTPRNVQPLGIRSRKRPFGRQHDTPRADGHGRRPARHGHRLCAKRSLGIPHEGPAAQIEIERRPPGCRCRPAARMKRDARNVNRRARSLHRRAIRRRLRQRAPLLNRLRDLRRFTEDDDRPAPNLEIVNRQPLRERNHDRRKRRAHAVDAFQRNVHVRELDAEPPRARRTIMQHQMPPLRFVRHFRANVRTKTCRSSRENQDRNRKRDGKSPPAHSPNLISRRRRRRIRVGRFRAGKHRKPRI